MQVLLELKMLAARSKQNVYDTRRSNERDKEG
jgi:hypothetical protein